MQTLQYQRGIEN